MRVDSLIWVWVAAGQASTRMAQTGSASIARVSGNDAETIDPSTRFMYTPHTITILLAGKMRLLKTRNAIDDADKGSGLAARNDGTSTNDPAHYLLCLQRLWACCPGHGHSTHQRCPEIQMVLRHSTTSLQRMAFGQRCMHF